MRRKRQLSVDNHDKTRDVNQSTQMNWVLSEFNCSRFDSIHVLTSSMQLVSRLSSVAHS